MTTFNSAKVNPYPHQLGGHCGSGAIRDLLEWAGLGWGGPPTEGLVFALSGALDLSYMRSPSLMPPVYLVGRGGDLELDLPRRLGATATQRATDDPDLGWGWVRAEIDAGNPVMVWSDIAELPYLRVRLRMSRHDIVIIGYDDVQRIAYVVDNDREEVQEVPYEALARARSSTSFPEPTRHMMYDIAWPSSLPSLATTASGAFQQAAETMRGAGGPSIAPPEPDSIHATGLGAASSFAADIAIWEETYDEAELGALLFGLYAFIEKAGTGGGLFRRLLAEGSAEIANKTQDKATEHLAAAATSAANAWTQLAIHAGQKDLPIGDRAARAVDAAQLLPALEASLVEHLDSAAESLASNRMPA